MDEEIPAGFYPVQVEIGIQDNYNVEIKSGVEEGDRCLHADHDRINVVGLSAWRS